MFAATNGKVAIAARPSEDKHPAYYINDYVDAVEYLLPNNNRTRGKGWIVSARGTGTGTIVDVAYCKAYDDGPTILPDYYPQKVVDEITQSFGRVHRSIPFKAVTRLPMLIGRRDIPKAKRVRTTPTRLHADLEEEEAPSEWPKNPGDMIIDRHRDEIKRRRARGWLRE